MTQAALSFEIIRHHRIDYEAAWEMQQKRVGEVVAGRAGHTLYLLEHSPVYTLGRSGKVEEVLDDSTREKIPLVETDRGGRVTYHGPGQMIAYVVWDLRPHSRMVRKHVTRLEESILKTLSSLGITATREPDNPGVWVDRAKIAALGVRITRGVAYHGVALNRDPDLSHFDGIIPCGLQGRPVTSLAKLGVDITREELEERYLAAFREVFEG
ncbi:MAG: lipoyl(octanoyl) transferase LipB [Magnetococcales bacterium]|nr:lipoyl(octanoyl) transferase LipB [Magnetococcales bacterium]